MYKILLSIPGSLEGGFWIFVGVLILLMVLALCYNLAHPSKKHPHHHDGGHDEHHDSHPKDGNAHH